MQPLDRENDSDDKGQFTLQETSGSLEIVQAIFRQVRPLLLEKAGHVDHTDKQDGSPVTNMDIEVERLLQTALADPFPNMPVFGEEAGYGTDLPNSFWLVDPIDGTYNFIRGIPTYTSMAVLIQNGTATASVIYNPSSDDMYIAQSGKGAYKNGTRLDIRTIALPPVALCKEQFIPELNDILRSKGVSCEQAPTGGGYGFTMVLDGLAAARFNMHSGGYVHDYAPGALLVREAGGTILPILEDEYHYTSRSFVACHPELESTLRPYVSRLRELESK